MDLEQQLRAALVPCEPGPEPEAAVMARVSAAARRKPSRVILFGTLLVVAAAASMLVMKLTAVPPAVAALPAGQAAATGRIEPATDAVDTLRADAAKSAAGARTILAGPSPQTYTVQVMPLRLPGADPAVQAALNEFYATAVAELGTVPGLVLLAPGDATNSADYRLTFNGGVEEAADIAAMLKESGQVQAVPAAQRTWRMQLTVESRRAPQREHAAVDVAFGTHTLTLVDGRSVVSTSGQADVDPNFVPSNLQQRIAEVTGGASATSGSGAMTGVVNLALNRRLQGVRVDVDYGVNESGARVYQGASVEVVGNQDDEYAQKKLAFETMNLQQPDGYTLVYANSVMGSPVQGPAGLAATEIERLRMAVFPVDAELTDKLHARLLDANQPYEGRFAALQLLTAQEQGMGNAATIHGALALLPVAPDVSRRAMVWRLLRGKPQPAALRPLLDLLGTARDATLRLEILTTLAADYQGAPAVQAALKSIAANDQDALVRNVAMRGVSGDAAWREYAAATIGDERLTPAERFAPLSYLLQADQGQEVRNLLDAQTLQALVAVLPPLLEDAQSRSRATTLLGELYGVDSPPAVDIVLASLDRGMQSPTRSMLIDLLGRHRDEPRARQRLEEIAASESDPKLRALAAALLRMPAAPGK